MQHWFSYPTNVDPVAIHLGPIQVHWYGISYLAGFVAVYLWMSRPQGRLRLGLSKEEIQDFLFYALIGVLVGGRTFFVINDIISQPHHFAPYLANPINFIAVWQGGMAFHGGMIGVIIAIWLFVRKHPRVKFTVLGDEVVVLISVGIFLTRIVNFINDELWGDVCNPDRPWCIQFPAATPNPLAYRHPAQIYEAIFDILTLPVIVLLYGRKPPDGVVAWTWFTMYGITRSVAEIWRQPDFTLMGITGGQIYALPMIAIGIAGIVYCMRRNRRTDVTEPSPAANPA